MNIFTCQRCGAKFESPSNNAKYCEKCRLDIKRITARNSYYKRIGELDKVEKITKKPKPKKSGSFVWKGGKYSCPLGNCSFRSGNRPCLFYIERKDGTATCPNAKALRKFMQQKQINHSLDKGL